MSFFIKILKHAGQKEGWSIQSHWLWSVHNLQHQGALTLRSRSCSVSTNSPTLPVSNPQG